MYRKIEQKVQRVAIHAVCPPLPAPHSVSPVNILHWYGAFVTINEAILVQQC